MAGLNKVFTLCCQSWQTLSLSITWLQGYLAARKGSGKPRQDRVIKPYTHFVETKEQIWNVWRQVKCEHVSCCQHVSLLFTLVVITV